MQDLQDGISVVIPNYNGLELLQRNLPFLFEALKKIELPHEVIVSDDCSTDESIDYLKSSWPHVRITQTKQNSGFSTACNCGISAVRYCYTCIMNSDVTFGDSYFANALPHFEDPGLFAVKGDIINYRNDDFNDIHDTNKDVVVYFKYGFYKFKDVYKIKSLKYDYPAVLLGACFLCRTAILKELGGFDEIFAPFYKEDLDLAIRAIKHGYKLKYIPDCGVHHRMGSTINRTQVQWRKYMISKRNKFLLAWKHINTLPRWMSHIFFVTFSLLTRWIILDLKWYTAFFCALSQKLKMGRKGNQYPI